MKNDNLKEQYRINERIRVREVRLVGDNIDTRSSLVIALAWRLLTT